MSRWMSEKGDVATDGDCGSLLGLFVKDDAIPGKVS